MMVYQCEDSLEGMLTAIYNTYEDKQKPEDTCISLTDEWMLFAEYVPVPTDDAKAQKVMNALFQKFGRNDYYQLCLALSAADPQKAQAVYQTIAEGLAKKCPPNHLFDNLTNQYIHAAFSLARGALREYDHLKGFLRFEELEQGILYAEMNPTNHLLPFLMEHFVDRLPMENFMIYDKGRKCLAVHGAGAIHGAGAVHGTLHTAVSAACSLSGSLDYGLSDCSGSPWFMVQCDIDPKEEFSLVLSEREYACQELFRYFCHAITIKERQNLNLQRNMLPLRFREYMTEFRL